MKVFYGWIVVGVGIVVTCIGVGAMLSLSVFLQPVSEAMAWSRTGISTAALLNWLCMRDYFGPRIMGTTFGAVAFVSTLGMSLGPWAGGWLYDALGTYFWLFIGSLGIGLGAVAIACTFRPPDRLRAGLPAASVAR